MEVICEKQELALGRNSERGIVPRFEDRLPGFFLQGSDLTADRAVRFKLEVGIQIRDQSGIIM